MAVMLLEWVFTSIFLILVVLAIRAALGKRMSAGLRYALWAVVLVRLLVPVQLFHFPLAGTRVFSENYTEKIADDVWKILPAYGSDEEPILNSLGGQDGPSVTMTAFPQAPNPPSVPETPEPPSPPDLTKAPAWLGWAWLAGTAAAALVFLLSNLRFFWVLRRERIPLGSVDCPLRVYVAVDLPSPCLFGIFRPAVYVTPDAAADPDMLRHVLAHEYTHFRHGDHIWSLLRCIALAVHWWNPLVWLAAVLSQRDAELACDEGALKRLGDGERAAYGGTLLALVTAKPRPGDLFRCATTMTGDKKSLKERITRIAKAPRRILWAAAMAVMVTALACLCAFGHGSPEDRADPSADFAPAPTPEPTSMMVVPGYNGTEAIPMQVQRDAEELVRERFESLRDDGVMFGMDGASVVPDPPEVDQWRVEKLTGPYWSGELCRDALGIGRRLELWNVAYAFHTTTPEKADNLGTRRLLPDGSGWITQVNYGADYLVYELGEDGSRTFLMNFAEQGDVISVLFRRNLRIKLAAGGIPEDMADFYYAEEQAEFPLSDLVREVDLNRNGIPELVQLVKDREKGYERLEVWEGNNLIWCEEGYYAHAGWNAVFLCTQAGEDYLLRYNPVMYQGSGRYTYTLFTLEGGQETVEEQNSVELNINISSPLFSGPFDPEAIADFMAQVNWYLNHSVQLMNTDDDLWATFEKLGRLEDDLRWLDWFEPEFVRDESKPLLVNLMEFYASMEPYDVPTVRAANEDSTELLLSYHGKQKQFSATWSWWYQATVEPQLLDLNGDGKDEIVFTLVAGHGTGVLLEELYVFDADTLEQYDTSGLTEMILSSIQSTGDEENFYLTGLDLNVVIPKKEAAEKNEDASVADSLGMGDYVEYEIKDGKVFCRAACDASGRALNYIGSIRIPVLLTSSGGFACGSAQYAAGTDPE